MIEPLVTKTQALALKELGMELPYIVSIDPINDNPEVIYTPQLPTVALALKFMREKYGFYLLVIPTLMEVSKKYYKYEAIVNDPQINYYASMGETLYELYDNCESAGLDKLIEIAKQNINEKTTK